MQNINNMIIKLKIQIYDECFNKVVDIKTTIRLNVAFL